MQSLMFLDCFVQKLSKKNLLGGWLDSPSLVKEGLRKSFKVRAKALVIQMHFQMRFHLKKQKYCYVFTSCPRGVKEYDHENTYI